MPEPKGFLITPVGFDDNEFPRSLEVDADDALRITFETAGKGLVGGHGWIDAAWQKQAMPFGFSRTLTYSFYDLDTNDTDKNVNTTPVPSGEAHLITNLTIAAVSASCTRMIAFASVSTVLAAVFCKDGPTNGYTYDRQPWVVLMPTDFLRLTGYTMTNGDMLFITAIGVKIDIDQ